MDLTDKTRQPVSSVWEKPPMFKINLAMMFLICGFAT